jgi:tetratricopeptide (TPR) repeat protein
MRACLGVFALATCTFLWAAEESWETEFQAAKKAYLKRDFAGAEAGLLVSLQRAEQGSDEKPLFMILRQLGSVYRLENKLANARTAQERAVGLAERVYGRNKVEYADAEVDLAVTLRALTLSDEAMSHVNRAAMARAQALGQSHIDLANDYSLIGLLALDMQRLDFAKTMYKEALEVTETAAGTDSPRVLPLLDIMGRLYREENAYAEAEPYYTHALLIREATFGPEDAELISTFDNLGYVLFGQKKYAEAEPLYKRLLAVWEKSAGPDHPMVALTCDKVQLFYSTQGKYEDAEPYALRALAIRLKAHIDSLLRAGRISVAKSELAEGERLYRRAVALADDPRTPEDGLLPPLQTLRDLLKQLKRQQEAAVLDQRIKTVLMKKADREGRRPLPPKAQAPL